MQRRVPTRIGHSRILGRETFLCGQTARSPPGAASLQSCARGENDNRTAAPCRPRGSELRPPLVDAISRRPLRLLPVLVVVFGVLVLGGAALGGVSAVTPVKVNFQPASAPVPSGYTVDSGLAYSDARGFCWVTHASLSSATHVPLDLSPNTRDRNLESDQRLDTLIHMQYPLNGNTSAVTTPGAWEYALANGSYQVTVAVGDPLVGTDAENHVIHVEGVTAIAGFVPSGASGSATRHATATVTVSVSDGKFTVDALGGTNTKLDYVDIAPAAADTTPPAAPANVSATAGDTQVKLAWSANTEPDLAGYNVYLSMSLPVPLSSPVNGSTKLTTPAFLDTGLTNGTTYYYVVEAVDTSGNKAQAQAVSATPQAQTPSVNIKVNFQDQATVPPAGYVADWGQAYGARTDANQGSGLSYGWVVPGTSTPLNLVGNGRNRNNPPSSVGQPDLRLATFMHMQGNDVAGFNGVASPGAWEIAVPNGSYTVTVAVGDAAANFDSSHRINLEGQVAINNFVPTSGNQFATATKTVTVGDGKLTVDPIGGTNTKIDYITIASGSGSGVDTWTSISWGTGASAPTGLSEAGTTALDGRIYTIGGYTDSTYAPTNKVYAYTPATNSWQALANIPQAVTHMGVANDGRYIYAAGGYPPGVGTPQAFATSAVWRYDPTANTWTAMPSLPQARGGGALVLLNGVLHYFGGSDASRADRADHWTLALGASAWGTAASMPVARNHLGGVALGGKIYPLGGRQKQEPAGP